ncbi:Amyloid-beta A4 precursor protein-binding A member 1 [Desmophyllum pertusum]|uniref:Amyloid-beta A4 protein-binding A member 1 n=1 Tax=Desmophyllum pertusum TaxID=174260 RepID=A0A9W9ZQD4_9CNID|nr:Amyloid-beta A4 precursor protein-binding A member 1 [Desmophyllum pertusum]
MADADSVGHDLTFSEQKNPSKEALKGKRKGKHAVEERDRLKKRGTSKPGRVVVISGESTEPPFDDVPVDLSADHKDLVMEYSDMFEPSKGAGLIDIQDGDAISESSDTEIVAHTKEQIQYGNQTTSSESNSDDEGPPPLNSDEDDDDGGSDVDGIDGPPPLDSDGNAENTDDGEELATSPDTGSREELNTVRSPVLSERRGVKSSEDSESDSDSESGVKEAPPPLDSEEEEEENEESNPDAENVESANVDTVESYTHDSPAEEVDNDDDEQHDHNNDNDDDDNDDDEDDEQRNDNNDDEDDDKEEEEEEEEEENIQAMPHSPEPVPPEMENSEESEQSDSPAEAERQIPLQNQSDDSDDSIVDEKESDHEATVDSVEEVHVAASVTNEVSSSTLPYEHSPEDEQEDHEEKDVTEDVINSELNVKEDVVSSHHDPVNFKKEESPEVDSDHDSDESPEFVPMDDENELEWDVEDFEMPQPKTAKVTPKINAEVAEVDKLKKSFLETLKSEAEQTKVVETKQKSEPKKKEKVEKGLNAKNTVKDEKKHVANQDLKSEPGKYSRKVTKDTPPKPEQQRGQQTWPTKEKKKARPVSDLQADPRSHVKHKEEANVSASQTRKEVKKPRKSDSDAASDSSTRQKPQKTSSTESVSRQKKSSPVVKENKEKGKAAESAEVKKPKSKRTASKPVAVGTDHDDAINHHERKRHSDIPAKHSSEAKTKPRGRPTSNGHLSSSQEKLSLHSGRHDHGARDHAAHKHSGHSHDRSKHVWLCRDDEIHKLIAQKASLLKEYESGSLAGRKVFSGHKSRHKRDAEGPVDLPDVGFISNKPTKRQTRPLSEAIPDRAPYSSRRKEQRRSLQISYSGSSSDDDERTNRAVEAKRACGTFAVGLASRNIEQKEGEGESDSDHAESCEYCAAEKMSWDEYVKSCKQAVTQRRGEQQQEQQQPESDAADPCRGTLPLQLLQTFRLPGPYFDSAAASKSRERNPAWEGPHHPRNLLLGVVYTAKYLGSSQIMSPQSPNKAVRMEQAQEAVGRIKVPEGEDQPTTDVDLFISTERLKVVNSGTKEVMLDHSLRTVSFIADIGDVLVLMARQLPEEQTNQEVLKPTQILASVGTAQTDHKNIKITCHVFQAPEAQVIAKSIGQAFNVAYQEFLRQNGLTDEVVEDAEYSGVLEAQKILGEDLTLLADENNAKEVIVNKKPAEMLGVMIVESGWGSMIPCAIIAHLAKDGPAAKSGRLNVGDQILSVNSTSLVGLPLLECQNIIKGIRPTTKVVMKIVSCPPTVQVVVNRPDTKYQLGFSVQNGMICSLMRGSIAERGGVRVGHRIIEINGESVVATSHQHIVELLATTVGEIRMKTMPASMYRLLVGLETPQHI